MMQPVIPTTPTYRMADRLLDGRLAELVAADRAAGASWDEVARHLYVEGGVELSRDTLRGWFAASEKDTSNAASA